MFFFYRRKKGSGVPLSLGGGEMVIRGRGGGGKHLPPTSALDTGAYNLSNGPKCFGTEKKRG